ncbi:unc-112-related protein isoform X2 [Lepeophtheirus salmonis]|uniref:PH domain-containing protein n=1 Tax=Lepeophtheirus salmonis TaxID=72036 RepID=A0A0K2U2L9_LEPSM|nr:unc-112-related protein-like isoform X2 [Lepeophtheirus salmonis]
MNNSGMSKGGIILGDGSWNLTIFVTNLQIEKNLRVRSDLHIGGLMIRLVDELDIAMDWSDHAMWWPARNKWLDNTRYTLDQYNITADAIIHFTPMHKMVRIQLPDLRFLDCSLDFSVTTFNASKNLCRELGIRYGEELSLCKPLEPEHLKQNYQETTPRKKAQHPPTKDGRYNERVDTNTFIPSSSSTPSGKSRISHSNGGSLNGTLRTPAKTNGAYHSHPGTLRNGNYSPYSNGLSPASHFLKSTNISSTMFNDSEISLTHSPTPSPEIRNSQLHPRSLVERARMNVGWLDSTLSIMEQRVQEMDVLTLRFKYYNFYDINPKYDSVRINQIFEQAKWQILNEAIDCTEEEMLLFAALQLQVGLQSNVPQPHEVFEEDDDVDAALNDLQVTLEGSVRRNGDLTTVPQLADYLRYLKPKRFTLKSFKRHYFVLQDLNLLTYRNVEDVASAEPLMDVGLKGCEVTPEINISQNKYQIKLEVPSADGMSEILLRCEWEEQYAKWMAALRLAARGKTMADISYESEVKSIMAFLSMQRPAEAPVINPATLDINLEEYVAPRFLRKLRSKLRQRILEAHTNVKDLNLLEAKMNFIKAWQSLPDYGVSLFVVKFFKEKKEELLGIAANKIMRIALSTGDHIKNWRYSTMKAWNVNWESKHMMIQFEDEKNVIFNCLSADCKVVHEFIGGYIFLSMRSKDKIQQLDDKEFHKLTGNWE